MTNVFVTSSCPIQSAQALDSKRLLRMCLEAYDALCGALANHRYGRDEIPAHDPLPHKPRPRFRTHNVIRWCGADRLHYQWVLAHARALQAEARWRSGKTTNCVMFDLCDAYCGAHADELPTHYLHTDIRRITWYGAFNWNEFRETYSYAHKGRVALPPQVGLFDRYRLSLLHKWNWIDRRPSVWGRRGAPWWAADEVGWDWVQRTFGQPTHTNVDLRPECVRSAAGFQKRLRRLTIPAPIITLAEQLDPVGENSLTISSHTTTGVRSGALFWSPDATPTHRVLLIRQWDPLVAPLVVCMLNPSTADAFKNDPTVARVERVARRIGAGGYIILNAADLRATDPRELRTHPMPVSVHNLAAVRVTMRWVRRTWCIRPRVLVAWGGDIKYLERRAPIRTTLLRELRRYQARVVCLTTTKAGEPRHPLYLSKKIRLRPYESESAANSNSHRRNAARPHQRRMQRV